MKTLKKSFAFILAFVMLISALQMSAIATDPTYIPRVDITMSSVYGKTPNTCSDCFTFSKESHSHFNLGEGFAFSKLNSEDFYDDDEMIDCNCCNISTMILADEGYKYDGSTELYINNCKIKCYISKISEYYLMQFNFDTAPVELKVTDKDVSYNETADITIQSGLPEKFTLEVNGKKEISKGTDNYTSVNLDFGKVKNPQKATIKVYGPDGNQLFNIKGETEWTVDINVKNDIFSIIGAFFRMLFNKFDWGKSSFSVQI